MTDILLMARTISAGALLGAIFFGGLWWTVHRGMLSDHPAIWFFGSLLLRMSMALAGFYLVSDGRWEHLLLCLIGFVIARLVVKQLTMSSGESRGATGREAGYAP